MKTVTMESAEYGCETFEYVTTTEAEEGMKRLIKRAQEQCREDGIPRTISFEDQTVEVKQTGTSTGHLVRPDGTINTGKQTAGENARQDPRPRYNPKDQVNAYKPAQPQHTPGPWKIYKGNGLERRIAAETNTAICILYGPIGWHKTAESEIEQDANARLIATAPETAKERDELKEKCRELGIQLRDQQLVAHDSAIHKELLEITKELFTLLETHEPNWYLRGHYNRASKAIAKAEGRDVV